MKKIMGGHILKKAMGLVGYECIQQYKFISKTNNEAGYDVSVYATIPITIQAQVQPVSRSVYQFAGLDFQKDYIKIYTENAVDDLERNKEADRFMYRGSMYEALSNNAWRRPQGWLGALAVKIDIP